MNIFSKITTKTFWSVASFGVGIIGMVISNKNDAIQRQVLKEETAKEAARIVMEQLSKEQN